MCALVHVETLNKPEGYNQCQKETLRVFWWAIEILRSDRDDLARDNSGLVPMLHGELLE
jgi:hypothetical protein